MNRVAGTTPSEDPAISFSGNEWPEFDRHAVAFTIIVDGVRRKGLISAEALEDHFDAGTTQSQLIQSFRANRSTIEARAAALISAGRLTASGELLLRTEDFVER